MADRWYTATPDQLARRFNTNLSAGLSQKEALSRTRKGGENSVYPVPKGNFRSYLRHILTDYTSILLLLTALLAWYFDADTSALTMIGLLVLNCVLSAAVYIKAHRVLEDMGDYAQPTAKVMREGKIFLVKSKDVVPGDIIYVSAGDLVPADARLIEDHALMVLETRLTGQPHSMSKSALFREAAELPPEQQKNMLFASSIVTAGSGRAIVCAIGEDTLLCRSGQALPIVSHEDLKILTLLRKYCRTWSLCMVAMIFVLVVADVILNTMQHGLLESFITGLTLAVASMSEFYMAFGYILIARGIFGAAQSGRRTRNLLRRRDTYDTSTRPRDMNVGTMIKNTKKLEQLKDLTTLVLPKESLVSIRDIRVERVWANDLLLSRNDPSFRHNSVQVLRYAVISTGLYGASRLTARSIHGEHDMNHEERALIDAAKECGLYNDLLDSEYPIVDHRGVGGNSRYETTMFRRGGRYLVALRGEAQQLLHDCSYYRDGRELVRMTIEKRAEFSSTADRITRANYRVLAIATRESLHTSLRRVGASQTGLILEGFVAVLEPLLPGALYTVTHCLDAGMKLVVFSEDEAASNVALVRSLGILNSDESVISGRQLSRMRPGIVRLNLSKYRLYQALTLGQKQRMLEWLRESGEKVGVLAMEFDDLSLLSRADVAFTQSLIFAKDSGSGGLDLAGNDVSLYRQAGGIGCEALKFLSDVVVSAPDSGGSGGCNAVVTAIMYAKSIYKNMLRLANYLITSQTARFLMVLFGVLTGQQLLRPVQILFSGLIVDLAAVMILAFEAPSRTILSEKNRAEEWLSRIFIENWDSLLYGALWAATQILGYYAVNLIFPGTATAAQTGAAIFVSFMINQIIVLWSIAKEGGIFAPSIRFNVVSVFVVFCMTGFILLSLAVPSIGAAFGIIAFDAKLWLILAWTIVVVLGGSELKKRLQAREWPFVPRKRHEEESFFLHEEPEESGDRVQQIADQIAMQELFRDFDLASVFEASVRKSEEEEKTEENGIPYASDAVRASAPGAAGGDGSADRVSDEESSEEDALPSLTDMLALLRRQVPTSGGGVNAAQLSAAEAAAIAPEVEDAEIPLESLPAEIREKILRSLSGEAAEQAETALAGDPGAERHRAADVFDETYDAFAEEWSTLAASMVSTGTIDTTAIRAALPHFDVDDELQALEADVMLSDMDAEAAVGALEEEESLSRENGEWEESLDSLSADARDSVLQYLLQSRLPSQDGEEEAAGTESSGTAAASEKITASEAKKRADSAEEKDVGEWVTGFIAGLFRKK